MPNCIEKLYEEASNSIRHYSGAILTLKSLTIAQGFAILAAQGFLQHNNKFYLSLIAGGFGFVFTSACHFIGCNLMGHFNVLLHTAQKIEKELHPDWNQIGPWNAFEATSIRNRGNFLVRALSLHGHVVLLLLAFLGVAIHDIYELLNR